MTEKVEDLTVTYTEDGIETTKELDKVILSKGSWTTIIFRYRDWDRAKNEYGAEKYADSPAPEAQWRVPPAVQVQHFEPRPGPVLDRGAARLAGDRRTLAVPPPKSAIFHSWRRLQARIADGSTTGTTD